jgi:hypothetical protein
MMSLKFVGVVILLSISFVLAEERNRARQTIACYSKTYKYAYPPAKAGVNDRLCFGCSEGYPSSLNRGQRLYSQGGKFVLSMQPDNNLVLYDLRRGPEGDPRNAVWSTDTWEYPGNYSLFMEEDGFIKLSSATDRKDTIWCNAKTSKISGKDQPTYFVLGANGEMATYQCDEPYWASNTWHGPAVFFKNK